MGLYEEYDELDELCFTQLSQENQKRADEVRLAQKEFLDRTEVITLSENIQRLVQLPDLTVRLREPNVHEIERQRKASKAKIPQDALYIHVDFVLDQYQLDFESSDYGIWLESRRRWASDAVKAIADLIGYGLYPVY